MSRGTPCFFVTIGVGCGIYQEEDIRNDSVCSKFKCDWLTDETMPEEFKPSKSAFIVETYYASKEDQAEGINTYLRIVDAGDHRDMNVVAWAKSKSGDLLINIDGHYTLHGSPEFVERIQKKWKKNEEPNDNQTAT